MRTTSRIVRNNVLRTLSRTILGAGLVLVLTGCNSKPSPTSDAGTPVAGSPNADTPVAARAAYELDPAKHAIPPTPVSGMLGGVDVTPTVVLEGEYLVFRATRPDSPEPERTVLLKLRSAIEQPLPEGKARRASREPGRAGRSARHAQRAGESRAAVIPEWLLDDSGARAGKAGKLPARSASAFPTTRRVPRRDICRSRPRLPIEPPGLDDVPFINGSVTVAGAAPGAVLISGYVTGASEKTSDIGIAAVDAELAESPGGPKSVTSDEDKPRVTTLIAGDGKKLPSRYEHSKLTQGRYLTFAMLKNGPAAWKWVDIGERTTEKADLTIDAAKVGGLEVTAPLARSANPTGPGRRGTPSSSRWRALFELIALQLKLEQDIVARKAAFQEPRSRPLRGPRQGQRAGSRRGNRGRKNDRTRFRRQARAQYSCARAWAEAQGLALPEKPRPAAQRPAGTPDEGFTSRARSPFARTSISVRHT